MDGPSQKSMQVMDMPLVICNLILVQIWPSVQELSCLQKKKLQFLKESQKKSYERTLPKINAGHGHALGHLYTKFGPNPAIRSRVIVFTK